VNGGERGERDNMETAQTKRAAWLFPDASKTTREFEAGYWLRFLLGAGISWRVVFWTVGRGVDKTLDLVMHPRRKTAQSGCFVQTSPEDLGRRKESLHRRRTRVIWLPCLGFNGRKRLWPGLHRHEAVRRGRRVRWRSAVLWIHFIDSFFLFPAHDLDAYLESISPRDGPNEEDQYRSLVGDESLVMFSVKTVGEGRVGDFWQGLRTRGYRRGVWSYLAGSSSPREEFVGLPGDREHRLRLSLGIFHRGLALLVGTGVWNSLDLLLSLRMATERRLLVGRMKIARSKSWRETNPREEKKGRPPLVYREESRGWGILLGYFRRVHTTLEFPRRSRL
jgi:hypothetical protein